jgi:succinyl-CoA synthetase beta subunit
MASQIHVRCRAYDADQSAVRIEGRCAPRSPAAVTAEMVPGVTYKTVVSLLAVVVDAPIYMIRQGGFTRRFARLCANREQEASTVDLYEYQGKEYFARFGIPVGEGVIANTVDEAREAAKLGFPLVVKAQVLTGGRGKAGGVKVVTDEASLVAAAESILDLDIHGHIVQRLWIEQATSIAAEYYASFTLDRAARRYLLMCSARGGIEIEEVADETPDAIAREHIDPLVGLSAETARDIVVRAGLDPAVHDELAAVLCELYRCFDEGDADLVEVNPLVVTTDGRVIALDAKVTLDDSAARRHPEWEPYANLEALDPREQLAKAKGLQYVGLDGSVGIIANGAGLAMSTCDVVSQSGGSPANFLDIGGGANAEVMANALEVIHHDEKVTAILVNIFGGITRCDEVARGILQALDRVDIDTPIVVRLDGTNAAEGRAIIAENPRPNVQSSPTMLEAARLASDLAGVTI